MATTFNDGYQSITHPLSYSFYALVQTIEGSASLTSTGSATTAAGLVEHLASAVVGAGSVAVVAIGHRRGVAALSGSGTVSATGYEALLITKVLSGAGTVAATAYQIDFGASAVSGSATIAAIGAEVLEGASALSGAGSISITPYKIRYLESSISATGSSATIGKEMLLAAGGLTGTGLFACAVTIERHGAAASISGTGSVSCTSWKEAYAISPLSGTGTVSPTGTEVLYVAVEPLSVGSIAIVSTEILIGLPSTMSGTGTVSATGTEVLFASKALSGAATVASTGYKERFLVSDISGQGTVAATGYEILYAGKNIGGFSLVADIDPIMDLYESSALSGLGTVSASGEAIRMGTAAITGNGSISAIRTIDITYQAYHYALDKGGPVADGIPVLQGTSLVGVLAPYLYLIQIDGQPVTEQNRKFGMRDTYKSVSSNTRADGSTNKFRPVNFNKKTFSISWEFIGNDEESNFDFRKGRDFLKSVADDGLNHTLKVRDPDRTFDNGTYDVIVTTYTETLKRRVISTTTGNAKTSYDGEDISYDGQVGQPLASDSNYGAYFWDVSIELAEV